MGDYNTWFRRIAYALALTKTDTVEIFRAGGITLSNSHAENLRRKPGNRRGSPNLTADEFDAFTYGLSEWVKSK